MPSTPATPPTSEGVAVSLASSFYGMYAHSGFMRSLHEADIYPAQIAGASAGALVALLCAQGMRGVELEDFLMASGFRRGFWDWGAPFRLPGVLTSFFGSGTLSGKNMLRFLRRHLGEKRIEDFRHPRLQLAVSNLSTRQALIVEEGDAVSFTIASLAIPGLFTQQSIGGERWADGGIAQTVPFLHWLDDPDIHTIIIHRIDHEEGTEPISKRPTLASGLAESHYVITNRIHDLERRVAAAQGKRIIEVGTLTPHPRLFPNGMRPLFLERGRESGAEAARIFAETQTIA